MVRTNRTWRAWQGLGALLFGVLTPGIGNAQHVEKLLTEVARPAVVKIPADEGAPESYQLSAHHVLLVRTDEEPSAGFDNPQPGEPFVKNWKGSVDLLDIGTGVKTHLPGLTRLLHRTTVTMGPLDFEASPDGKWVFWWTAISRTYADRHAAHLDGTHYRKWKCKGSDEEFFLDDRHLVHLSCDAPVMTVRDLLIPQKDRKYRKPEQARAVLTKFAIQQPYFVDVPLHIGLVPISSATITVYRTEDRIQWLVHEDDPTQKAPQAVETREIKFPKGASLSICEVSPDQKSIVYYLETSKNPPLPFKPTRGELWVSRANGEGLHEIGYVPATLNKHGDPDIRLFDVHWLPDGKQISFYYQDNYYVVDATASP